MAVQFLACTLAGLSGFLLSMGVIRMRDVLLRQRQLKSSMRGDRVVAAFAPSERARASPLFRLIERESRPVQASWLVRLGNARIWAFGLKGEQSLIARAGLSGSVTPMGLRMARLKAVMAGMAIGALAGALFSSEFALFLGACGLIGGYCCIPLALKSRAAERNADMERHLSEMVEVVVLGLHSGLSFERSFMLYPQFFPTELGESMSRAVRQWDMGLVTREEALRALEAEYDSPLLSRVIGSMIRSLRFGTSIAESLESSAIEAREVHRARMEERVAKVAVEMMLPVGTLILPAMLLLVLGPVMLELVEGF